MNLATAFKRLSEVHESGAVFCSWGNPCPSTAEPLENIALNFSPSQRWAYLN